jgi:hypothetical protein
MCFTFVYFYVPVNDVMHEDLLITWLTAEAQMKETVWLQPDDAQVSFLASMQSKLDTVLSGSYRHCISRRVTQLLTLPVHRICLFL